MNNKFRTIFELIRIPNIFTAIADILAGFLFVHGVIEQWGQLLCLVVGSSCFYAAGIALNDVCDADRDALIRPNRPIPSGRISKKDATIFVVFLMIVGVGVVSLVSVTSVIIALALIASIVCYDVFFKSTVIASGWMGMCRALNLLLGMSISSIEFTSTNLIPIGLIWLYITSVTLFARDETGDNHPIRLTISTLCICIASTGLISLYWLLDVIHIEYIGLVVVLVILIGFRGLQAIRDRTPHSVQRAVKAMILGLILFDASLAWSVRGPVAALMIVLLLIPSTLLARKFRVT